MNRCLTTVCLLIAISLASGCCFKRCAEQCSPYGGYNSSARIPSPGTGSYTIPTQNANNPYYTPQAGATISYGQTQPVLPANQPSTFNATVSGQPNVGTAGFQRPVTGPSAGWTQQNQPSNSSSFYGPGNRGQAPNYNPTSYNVGTDYRTTSTNETNDPTRMPTSDATLVRAPAQVRGNNYQSLPPVVANLPGTARGTIIVPGSYEYRATPQINRNGPVVLAEATTGQQNNPNYQAGWQNRYTGGNQVR